MWLLRICSEGKWDKEKLNVIEEAMGDLTLREKVTDTGEVEKEKGLSVFRITGQDKEAERIALLFALDKRTKLGKICYILIPEEGLEALQLKTEFEDCPDLHSELRKRHYIIIGLEDEDKRRNLAKELLGTQKVAVIIQPEVIMKSKDIFKKDQELIEKISENIKKRNLKTSDLKKWEEILEVIK